MHLFVCICIISFISFYFYQITGESTSLKTKVTGIRMENDHGLILSGEHPRCHTEAAVVLPGQLNLKEHLRLCLWMIIFFFYPQWPFKSMVSNQLLNEHLLLTFLHLLSGKKQNQNHANQPLWTPHTVSAQGSLRCQSTLFPLSCQTRDYALNQIADLGSGLTMLVKARSFSRPLVSFCSFSFRPFHWYSSECSSTYT